MTEYMYLGIKDKILTEIGLRSQPPRKDIIHRVIYSDSIIDNSVYIPCSNRTYTTTTYSSAKDHVAQTKVDALRKRDESGKKFCATCWGDLKAEYVTEFNE